MKSILALVLLSAFAVAQEPADHAPYAGTSEWVHGVFILPVANKPFSAKAIIELTKSLADGTTITKKTWNTVARDSAGRTHNEGRRLQNLSDNADPTLMFYAVIDPATLTRTVVMPASHSIRRFRMRGVPTTLPPLPSPPNGVALGKLDLGETTLDGVAVHGTRETRTFSAGIVGNDRAFDVVDEYWFSPELQINMSVTHNDPRTGVQTVRVTELSRAEPDPALFQIPTDYKVTDGPAAGNTMRIGNGVTPPKPVYHPDPSYTDSTRKARISGKVVLGIVVQQDGSVGNIEIKQSLDPDLDEAAIQAVQSWRFQPAMKDGRPVAVSISVEVNFRLQ